MEMLNGSAVVQVAELAATVPVSPEQITTVSGPDSAVRRRLTIVPSGMLEPAIAIVVAPAALTTTSGKRYCPPGAAGTAVPATEVMRMLGEARVELAGGGREGLGCSRARSQ